MTNGILNEAAVRDRDGGQHRPAANIGKTGTAMDHSDAWFVGAIPQMVAAVWIGYPQGQIRMEPPRTRITVYGGTWPAHIWRLLMLEATRGLGVGGILEPAGRVRLGRRRRHAGALLPAQPVHAPAEHPDDGVHRRDRAPRDVFVPLVPAGGGGPIRCIGLMEPLAIEGLTDAGFYVDVRTAPSTCSRTAPAILQEPAPGTDAFQTSTVTNTIAWTSPEATPSPGDAP